MTQLPTQESHGILAFPLSLVIGRVAHAPFRIVSVATCVGHRRAYISFAVGSRPVRAAVRCDGGGVGADVAGRKTDCLLHEDSCMCFAV